MTDELTVHSRYPKQQMKMIRMEAAMVVLCGGTHIDKDEEEEERSARVGTYRGMRDAR